MGGLELKTGSLKVYAHKGANLDTAKVYWLCHSYTSVGGGLRQDAESIGRFPRPKNSMRRAPEPIVFVRVDVGHRGCHRLNKEMPCIPLDVVAVLVEVKLAHQRPRETGSKLTREAEGSVVVGKDV